MEPDLSAVAPAPDLAPAPCKSDDACRADGGSARCDVMTGKCVECTDDAHCPEGQVCRDKKCASGCTSMKGCGDAGVCDVDAGVCKSCGDDKECTDPSNPRCDVATRRCVPCLPDKDNCPGGMKCTQTNGAWECAKGCKTDDECKQGDAGPPGGACCNGVCVNTAEDNAHCGACGKACGIGTVCCASSCTDPMGDVNHCGACGKVCNLANAKAKCETGACVPESCTVGFADCDKDPANGCEINVDSNPAHCTACGMACTIANGTAGCNKGCTVQSCKTGFGDCDKDAMNGCEADTNSATDHCGGCGMACPAVPNGKPGCLLGQCVIGSCDDTFRDCDKDIKTGCEVDTATDTAHCGTCGKPCGDPANGVAGCSNGLCTIKSCKGAFKDCNGMLNDGCEIDTATDVAHCADCKKACPAVKNGTPGCAMSQCGVKSCDTGFSDCNKSAGDGCEIDTRTDESNCSMCGMKCPAVPNGSPACVMSKCGTGACSAPFQDCDGATPGCETDTSSDLKHCGGCNKPCAAVANANIACQMGCAITSCKGAFLDCDKTYANGCEFDGAGDAKHCGACGAACSNNHVPTPTCGMGKCTGTCEKGWDDCNGDKLKDGCEFAVSANVDHCGGCGRRCSANNVTTRACANGVCTGACDAGFEDCDKDKLANGCEINLRTDGKNCGACGKVCPTGTVCAAGVCSVPTVGNGADGALTTNGATTINQVLSPAAGTAGQSTLALAAPAGFRVGQTILIHQTQGADAGAWELNFIVALAANTATLLTPLKISYSNAGVNRAQAVVVPQYTSVTIGGAGTLTAPAWNGSVGGILALQATGTVTVGGTVTMTARGFRGSSHGCTRRCATGVTGESASGPGGVSRSNNGAGGGAGTGGQDCGMGGGGGHGTVGAGGPGGINCYGGCGSCPQGGLGGAAIGGADLNGSIFFGGAGGSGGGDEDGAYPGGGGNGGGIIVLLAARIDVTGTIESGGTSGGGGVSSGCGGGCGMGGGGGGAGGAVRLVATTLANLGASRVTAGGAGGGSCTCGGIGTAGGGGAGRVAVKSPTVTGTTTPPHFGG
jgi:Cys-rich repeat protein